MNVITLNFLLKTLKLIHAKGGVFKIAKLKYAQLKVTLRYFILFHSLVLRIYNRLCVMEIGRFLYHKAYTNKLPLSVQE